MARTEPERWRRNRPLSSSSSSSWVCGRYSMLCFYAFMLVQTAFAPADARYGVCYVYLVLLSRSGWRGSTDRPETRRKHKYNQAKG